MAVLDTILQFLRQQLGLTTAQAAGVAGNLQVESGFDPNAYNAGENAIGLAQWQGGRRQRLQEYARSIGSSETDLGTQLAFLAQELRGSESNAFSRLLATSTPGEAAAAFDQYYERSSGAARDTRIRFAEQIYTSPSGIASNLGGVPFFNNLGAGGTSSGSGSSSGSSGPSQSTAARMGGITGDVFTIGLKIMGAGAAAALVIVGAVHTVK